MKKQSKTHNRRKGGSRPSPIDALSHLDYRGNCFDLAPPSKTRPYYTIVGIHIGGGTQLEIPGTYRDTPIRCLSLLDVTNGGSIREVILPEQIETIQLDPSPSTPWYEALDSHTDYSFWEIPEEARQPPLPALEAITPCEGHPSFQSYEGILFSKDLKGLILCPWGNGLHDIKVPEETERVSSYAFFLHPTLEAVQFQGALRSIESNAFSICLSLESVDLSACSQLSLIERHAFNRCKIQRITFPDAPFSLGFEAFVDALYGDVILPPTVKKLGVSSLPDVRKVTVVEGSAKGLFRALESAKIHILQRENGGEALSFSIHFFDTFPIIKELSKAWDKGEPLLPVLDNFIGRSSGPNCLILALTLFLQFPDQPDIPHIRAYVRTNAFLYAKVYLENKSVEGFLTFLRTGILPPEEAAKLLPAANRLGLADCSAYLLEYCKDSSAKENFPL